MRPTSRATQTNYKWDYGGVGQPLVKLDMHWHISPETDHNIYTRHEKEICFLLILTLFAITGWHDIGTKL